MSKKTFALIIAKRAVQTSDTPFKQTEPKAVGTVRADIVQLVGQVTPPRQPKGLSRN